MSNYQNLQTILSTTNRISFNNQDLRSINEYIKMSQAKGYDIRLDSSLCGEVEAFQEALNQGYIILSSVSLDTSFLFANIDGGKGFFGGQKTKVVSFIGPPESFSFTPGHVFNKLVRALTSINNIFRG